MNKNRIRFSLYNILRKGKINRAIVEEYDAKLNNEISDQISLTYFTTHMSVIGVKKLESMIYSESDRPIYINRLEYITKALDALREQRKVLRPLLNKNWNREIPNSFDEATDVFMEFDKFKDTLSNDTHRINELCLAITNNSSRELLYVLISDNYSLEKINRQHKDIASIENILSYLQDPDTIVKYDVFYKDLQDTYREMVCGRYDFSESTDKQLAKVIEISIYDAGVALIEILDISLH